MKKIALLMLGLVAGTASFAQQSAAASATPTPRVSVTADQKLKLTVGRSSETATVSLWDNSGNQLYTERVKLQTGIYQTFDIAQLSSGTYQLTVTMGSAKTSRTFTVAEQPARKQIVIQQA